MRKKIEDKNRLARKKLEKLQAAKKSVILSVETAVEGGSLALFKDGAPVDGWVGTGVVSRSEDVLGEIKNLLEKNALEKREINSIIVSNGPGSYTGARIGAAIVRGLCKALGCDFCARSVLEAMASAFAVSDARGSDASEKQDGAARKIITAIPFGRERICRQRYLFDGSRQILHIQKPETATRSAFALELRGSGYDSVILHETLYLEAAARGAEISPDGFETVKMIDAGSNLAELLGREPSKAVCRVVYGTRDEAENQTKKNSPIYVRDF